MRTELNSVAIVALHPPYLPTMLFVMFRKCIGEAFGRLETTVGSYSWVDAVPGCGVSCSAVPSHMQVILASWIRHLDFELLDSSINVPLEAGITLRPGKPILMNMKAV